MKMKMKIMIAFVVAFVANNAFAQPNTVVGSASGQAGTTVTIPVTYNGTAPGGGINVAGSVIGVQVDINYDNALLTPNLANCGAAGTGGSTVGTIVTCSNPVVGMVNVVRIVALSIPNAVAASGSLGTIDFAIGAAAPVGALPLTVSGEVYDDGSPPGDVAPNGSMAGAVNVVVVSPQYTSVVTPGTTIALGQILQGGTNPADTLSITNSGDVGTTLTGTCTAAAPFIIGSGAFTVAQGAATPAVVDISCDSTAAPMVYNGTLSCGHDGSNMPNPATYPLTCEVLAAAATGDQNPVSGTASNFIVSPSGTLTSTVVTFSEVGGQGVAITDLACTITPGVGFAITSPAAFPATVPAAGSLPVVVTFTDPGDGSATAGSLDCTYTDGTGAVAVSYPLNFIIRAVNVPALSMMGYLVLTLGFGLIGFFAFRRRA